MLLGSLSDSNVIEVRGTRGEKEGRPALGEVFLAEEDVEHSGLGGEDEGFPWSSIMLRQHASRET